MKTKIPLIMLVMCATLFYFGLVHLFKLRFEAGDVFPPYSSLRADPLGAQAYYESLERMPGLVVRRDYSRVNRLPEGKAICYLHLAARAYDWRRLPEELFKEIEAFTLRGGRLVITLLPEIREPKMPRSERIKDSPLADSTPEDNPSDKKNPQTKRASRQQRRPPEERKESRRASLRERWGVEFAFVPLSQRADGIYESVTATNATLRGVANSLSWHSGLVFTNLDAAWRVIYTRDLHPVLVERAFGSGTVVFATDSYFLSNQALREERHADLLAWIVGASRRVVFDEAHLGVLEDPGVATLIRKYNLHGTVAALLLLAALFVWKNSLSFVPPHPDEETDAHVLGKESAAGFVNLLRRNLASGDVLNACHAEWRKSFARDARVSAAKQERIQAVLDAEKVLTPRERNPVRAYQTISAILSERTWKA